MRKKVNEIDDRREKLNQLDPRIDSTATNRRAVPNIKMQSRNGGTVDYTKSSLKITKDSHVIDIDPEQSSDLSLTSNRFDSPKQQSTRNNNSKSDNQTSLKPSFISSTQIRSNGNSTNLDGIKIYTKCAACNEVIRDNEALKALDCHWHVWCFKCTHCKISLHGDYVAKDGKPYCEKDYQKLFGVICVYCKRYITGKVLQAGDNHHFHPSCARCSKCGDPFVPGEEMYLQGEVTWHPRCGPGPDSGVEDILGSISMKGSQLHTSRGQSPSLYSNKSRSRSASPYSFMSRQYGRASPAYQDSEAVGDLSRIYTISYLTSDPSQTYLKRPIEPNPPKSPQFTRPVSSCPTNRARSRSSSRSLNRSGPRSGMYSILNSMRSSSSTRPKSPNMQNEEAIHLSHYPAGQRPNPDEVPKIERDDFPAPPFPYTNGRNEKSSLPGKKYTDGLERPQSTNSRQSRPRSRNLGQAVSLEDDSSNDEPQLSKEEKELSKIATGIGKIFLNTLKEREKLRAWKKANLDPRNASRTPSATRELSSRLRYEDPRNASPSRDLDRSRDWDDDDDDVSLDRSIRARSLASVGGSSYGYRVVPSSMRSTPKPVDRYERPPFGVPTSYLNENRSTTDLLHANSNRSTSAAHSNLSARNSYLRRSMPNVTNLNVSNNPPKLYPYHLLITSNYRLPAEIDRCHLECHLSNEEFLAIFHCDRSEFYQLPEWKRNELKRRALLF